MYLLGTFLVAAGHCLFHTFIFWWPATPTSRSGWLHSGWWNCGESGSPPQPVGQGFHSSVKNMAGVIVCHGGWVCLLPAQAWGEVGIIQLGWNWKKRVLLHLWGCYNTVVKEYVELQCAVNHLLSLAPAELSCQALIAHIGVYSESAGKFTTPNSE